MTAISTILSIVMLPLNLVLYVHLMYRGQKDVVQNLEWTSLLMALAIVITAIALGLYCSARYRSRRFNYVANQMGNLCGLSLVIMSIVLATVGGPGSSASDDSLWTRPWTFYVAVVIPPLGGLVLANCFAWCLRLKRPEQVTVAIECCYQNVGVATSLALTMFNGNDEKDAMAVPFLYGLTEAVIVGIYCLFAWKLGWTKAPANENICKVLVMSYEVLEYVRKDLNGIEVTVSECESNMTEEINEEGSIITCYFNAFAGSGGPEEMASRRQRHPRGSRGLEKVARRSNSGSRRKKRKSPEKTERPPLEKERSLSPLERNEDGELA